MEKLENPSKNTLTHRLWRDKHKKPCLDCGTLICHKAIRCRSCNQKILNFPRRQKYYCIDCGALLSKKGCKRCRFCYKKGRLHPMWKGGRNRTTSGYILVHKPDYHRAGNKGYVFEEVLVWEQANGVLPKGMLIHHLNGIKDDNELSNLVAVSPREHGELHRKMNTK